MPSDRPRMCPSCGTLVGTKATKCHQCGANLSFGLAAVSRSLSGLLPTQSPVTYVFLTINMILFVLSLMASLRQGGSIGLMGGLKPEVQIRLGMSVPIELLLNPIVLTPTNMVVEGQWWRLITAIFLHGGILHIAMNTWVLLDIGPAVEELYGSARYLFVYIVTGAAGFLASSWIGHFSVGASASLMGLIGALIAVTSRRGGAYMQTIRGSLIRWVVYIFVLGFLVSGIDNAAHLGGLASGFILGRLLPDREPQTPQERRTAYTLGWVTALAVIGCLGLMLRFYFATAAS